MLLFSLESDVPSISPKGNFDNLPNWCSRGEPAPHEEATRQLTYSQHISPYFRVSQEATSRPTEDSIEKHSSHSQIVLTLHLVLPIILTRARSIPKMVKTYNVPYYNFTSNNLRNKLDSVVTVTTNTKVLYYSNRGPRRCAHKPKCNG